MIELYKNTISVLTLKQWLDQICKDLANNINQLPSLYNQKFKYELELIKL